MFWHALDAVRPGSWGTEFQFMKRYTHHEKQRIAKKTKPLSEINRFSSTIKRQIAQLDFKPDVDSVAARNQALPLEKLPLPAATSPDTTVSSIPPWSKEQASLVRNELLRINFNDGDFFLKDRQVSYNPVIDVYEKFTQDPKMADEFYFRLRASGALRRAPTTVLQGYANVLYIKASKEYREQEAALKKQMKHSVIHELAIEEKWATILEWHNDWLEENPDKKIVIFFYNISVGERLFEWARSKQLEAQKKPKGEQFNFVFGFGTKKSEQIENSFQNDPSCRVALLSYGVGREALTLTAAHNMSILQADEASRMWQAMYRIDRLGQKFNPAYHLFILLNSYEEGRIERVTQAFLSLDNALDREKTFEALSTKPEGEFFSPDDQFFYPITSRAHLAAVQPLPKENKTPSQEPVTVLANKESKRSAAGKNESHPKLADKPNRGAVNAPINSLF
jgi:hypothetical protein